LTINLPKSLRTQLNGNTAIRIDWQGSSPAKNALGGTPESETAKRSWIEVWSLRALDDAFQFHCLSGPIGRATAIGFGVPTIGSQTSKILV
jgi:hypothetical protein